MPYIVGIGASAGGLHAFEEFFKEMPPDSGLAFIIVPHLDPTHVSILPDLLAKYTRMPVIRITGGEKIESNRVYVVPQNSHLSIDQNRLTLSSFSDAEPRGTRLPIDFFLRSLAEQAGDRAICVLLSGNGSDGSLGLREVKSACGLVVVQEPSTAQYPGLPQSAIDTGMVDFVLPPGKMPDRLVRYIEHLTGRRAPLGSPGANEILKKICWLVQQETGHDFSSYKQNTVVRRIERRLSLHQIDNPADYVHYIEKHPEEAQDLFKELLIGVTSFFRDKEVFDALRTKIIPQWLIGKPNSYTVRIWVPGCSGGEEAYSLAIIFTECLAELKSKCKVQVFGTDIDANAIEKARAGIYPRGIESSVSPDRLNQFFTIKGDMYQIRKDIREMVIFAPQNVTKDPPFTRLDFVSCRNLLIYMDAELQKQLLPLFHYSLRPEGVLLLGTSESVGSFTDLFTVLDKKCRIYRRKESPALRTFNFNTPAMPTDMRAMPPAARDQMLKQKDRAGNLREVVEKSLLNSYAPCCAVINEKSDVVYIHGRCGKFLEPAQGNASLNLLNMARDSLRLELASAVRKALVKKKDVIYESVRVRGEGGTQSINLSVRHIRQQPELEGLLLVVFETGSSNTPIKKSKVLVSGRETRLRELERELKYTREYLQTTIEQLETSNEELKSTNEELQSTNEEMQSTNEEMETSKEELQSVNEELFTVNAELQAKIEELAGANNDMMNLLNSTQIATVFVDNLLNLKRFTDEATRIINFVYSDIGRPIRHISSNLKDNDLEGDIGSVIHSLKPLKRNVQTKDDVWYDMRIIPYRSRENVIDGAVLTFHNISQQKSGEKELEDVKSAAETNFMAASVLDMVQEALLVMDSRLRIIYANRPFCQKFSVDSQEVKGKLISEIGSGSWARLPISQLLYDTISKNAVLENYRVEHEFEKVGFKRLVLSARKTYSQHAGEPVIMLSIREVTNETQFESTQ